MYRGQYLLRQTRRLYRPAYKRDSYIYLLLQNP